MLSFSDVDVSIAGISILRGLTFRIAAGDTVALIGRNGAGKTTTMRTVMGFTNATGKIAFDNDDLSEVRASRRAGLGIGYAPEDRRLFSAFTIEENILMPGQVARLEATELARRLERVYSVLPELKEMAGRPAGTVSGGQGKMVALGRALMIGTRLIMLDEPFQGLAPALAQRYAEALRRLRSSDSTVALLVSESNPALLTSMANRTLTIERGEILES
ncbi:MAG: ABC transporter ATP-binding protein [Burkholderiaceae bacterium]